MLRGPVSEDSGERQAQPPLAEGFIESQAVGERRHECPQFDDSSVKRGNHWVFLLESMSSLVISNFYHY
jgi:hypothetical protein